MGSKDFDATIVGRTDVRLLEARLPASDRRVIERERFDRVVDVHEEMRDDILHSEKAAAVLRARTVEE